MYSTVHVHVHVAEEVKQSHTGDSVILVPKIFSWGMEVCMR